MRITVAICTWNRCELLRQTLAQLVLAAVPPDTTLEVLVVNNGSTDATDAVVDEFQARLPIRRVFEARPGLSHARNTALSAASGDYVIFTDDDVLVSGSWLLELTEAIRAFPQAAAVGGIIEPWFPEQPDPDLVDVFPSLKSGFCGLDHRREPGPLPEGSGIWGANMAFRRTSIEGLTFNPDLGPSPTSTVCADETDFLVRLRDAGGCVVWWPEMRVRHYVLPSRMTEAYLLRFTAGKGTEAVLTAPPRSAPSWFGTPRWLWLTTVKTGLAFAREFVAPSWGGQQANLFSGQLPNPLASRRVRVLAYRRELAFLCGMMRGYRRLHMNRPGSARLDSPLT